MAEINIEKRKPVWPWILLAVLVLIIIIWMGYKNGYQEKDNELPEPSNIENTNYREDLR